MHPPATARSRKRNRMKQHVSPVAVVAGRGRVDGGENPGETKQTARVACRCCCGTWSCRRRGESGRNQTPSLQEVQAVSPRGPGRLSKRSRPSLCKKRRSTRTRMTSSANGSTRITRWSAFQGTGSQRRIRRRLQNAARKRSSGWTVISWRRRLSSKQAEGAGRDHPHQDAGGAPGGMPGGMPGAGGAAPGAGGAGGPTIEEVD